MRLRAESSLDLKKKPVGLCFTGREGYDALEVLEHSKEFGFTKSGLVVELLNLYGEAREKFGDIAIYKLLQYIRENEK